MPKILTISCSQVRFPVSHLLGLLASGETKEAILKAYPYLEAEDIDEALRYAVYTAEEEMVWVCKVKFLVDMQISSALEFQPKVKQKGFRLSGANE